MDLYDEICDGLRDDRVLVRLADSNLVWVDSVGPGPVFWSQFSGCNQGSRRLYLDGLDHHRIEGVVNEAVE